MPEPMPKTMLEAAEGLIGYQFSDHELLQRCLTHASLTEDRLMSNERLEFLGDAVLGMVVCDYLYEQFPDLLEGEMTKVKSMVVSRRVCAELAQEMGLAEALMLGKGMSTREGLPMSVAAAVYESVLGAVYVDGGLEAVKTLILSGLKDRIHHAVVSGHHSNFKSVLQQIAQQAFSLTPTYCLLDEKGPDHAKCFEIAVTIGDRRFDPCWGSSKKQAEQEAALSALEELGYASRHESGEIHVDLSAISEE
ncbi:MAG: ribonuclease III [Phycisphaerae bacterium]|nr:ribonuclease III [Phycisphaerae bacterium]|tara:strand:- start:420 stop:1169 length:750 start_codon:yes stop_codon:yes gene_type:complete